MLSDFVPPFSLQIRISRRSWGTAYQMNRKTHKLTFETAKKYNLIYKILRVVHYSYATFMFGTFIRMFMVAENEGITIEQVLSVGWICCHVGSGCLCAGLHHKVKSLRRVYNNFVEFEERLVQDIPERTKAAKIAVAFLYALSFASIGMPTFICLMLYFNPCMPPTLGYTMMNCKEMEFPSMSYYLNPIFYVFNLFSWYNAFAMAYFLIYSFYLPQLSLKDYVTTLKKVTLRHQLGRKIKTETAQRELLMKMYRRLQLLALEYNDCYGQVFLPLTMVACMTGAITSLFVLVRLHSVVPGVGILFFSVKMVILFGMFNFVFGFGGRILAGSEELLELWAATEDIHKAKWFQRTLISLVSLKIKYGNGGFIDRMTPLMLDAFLVDQTVNLLLIVP